MNKTLLVQIDQGTQGGPVANHGDGLPGGPALENAWRALAPLRGKYDVVFGLCPVHPDETRTTAVLDTLVGFGAGYCLDVASSDVLSMPAAPWRQPYLQPYGVAARFQFVKSMMERHGPAFRGMRLHEVGFWYQQGIPKGRSGALDWWQGFADRCPVEDNVWHPEMLEPYVRHCAGQGRWLCWSEPSVGPATAAEVARLTNRYPHTVVPCYANNIAGDAQVGNYWPKAVRPCVTSGSLGWGLSLQSWRWSDDGHTADEAEYLTWAASSRGAVLLEVEPAGYLFNLPIVWEPWQVGVHDGSPLPTLSPLIDTLLSL